MAAFGDIERRLAELRFINGVEKVEHVPFSTGDEFWVRLNQPIDMEKLQGAIKSNGAQIIKFGGLPSKLPSRLGEVLWNGVTHVIVKRISGWERFTSKLGFEPEGIAKIVKDLHGPYQIFIATHEDGVHILYDYFGLGYVPPAPSPPQAAAKPLPPTTPQVTPPPRAATPNVATTPPQTQDKKPATQ